MTYPKVTITGENLPEPHGGWDDRERSDGNEAVFFPTRFEVKDSFVYLEWETDEETDQMWIQTANVDSITSTHTDPL